MHKIFRHVSSTHVSPRLCATRSILYKRYFSGPVDPYVTLGVDRKASDTDIKKAFFQLAKKYHPDVNPSTKAKEKFMEISSAYEILKDKNKRAHYDMQHQTGTTGEWQQAQYRPQQNQYNGRAASYSQSNQSNDFTWYQKQYEEVLKEFQNFFHEETIRNKSRARASNQWHQGTTWTRTTIERDAYGNIHVRTEKKGGDLGGQTTWRPQGTSWGLDELMKRRGYADLWKNRENIRRAFTDPWYTLQNLANGKWNSAEEERPTILDFPSKFSITQHTTCTENQNSLFEVASNKDSLGWIKENTKSIKQEGIILTFEQKSKLTAKARSWIGEDGLQRMVIEDLDGIRIASVIERRNSMSKQSVLGLWFSSVVKQFSIYGPDENILGTFKSIDFLVNNIRFYDLSGRIVAEISGSYSFFGISSIEDYNIFILPESVWDAAVFLFPVAFKTVWKQRTYNIVKETIKTVSKFYRNIVSVVDIKRKNIGRKK